MKNLALSLLLLMGCSSLAQPAIYKINDLLKRTQHSDTTYVLNFWATWCKPCVKELPAFDSLHLQSRNKPVKVILVSLDFADDLDKRLVPFLKKHRTAASCVLLDESNGNDFINRIDPTWSGAIPATFFKKNNKRIFAERSLTLKELIKMVEVVQDP